MPEPTDTPAYPAVTIVTRTHKEEIRTAPDGTIIGYQHYSNGEKVLYYTVPANHPQMAGWTVQFPSHGAYIQEFDYEFNTHFALCDQCRYHRHQSESIHLLCQEGKKLTAQYATEGFPNKYAELFRLGLII